LPEKCKDCSRVLLIHFKILPERSKVLLIHFKILPERSKVLLNHFMILKDRNRVLIESLYDFTESCQGLAAIIFVFLSNT
jgi:hypothetical protein